MGNKRTYRSVPEARFVKRAAETASGKNIDDAISKFDKITYNSDTNTYEISGNLYVEGEIQTDLIHIQGKYSKAYITDYYQGILFKKLPTDKSGTYIPISSSSSNGYDGAVITWKTFYQHVIIAKLVYNEITYTIMFKIYNNSSTEKTYDKSTWNRPISDTSNINISWPAIVKGSDNSIYIGTVRYFDIFDHKAPIFSSADEDLTLTLDYDTLTYKSDNCKNTDE